MIRRIAGVVLRPRVTFTQLIEHPVWLGPWVAILILWGACAAVILGSEIGRQAVVDERVRVIETFGGSVTDKDYAAILAAPPWWIYFTSGGRILLTPVATLLTAALCWAVAARYRPGVRFAQALAIAVHASVALVLGQLFATPTHYVRESLTTPLNLAALLPLMEEGSLQARFFGSIDLFTIWWLGLLAVGLSALTGQPTRRFGSRLAVIYIIFAGVMAGVIATVGGA